MPTERGPQETEKMRLLLANLFFARVFFVQHNLSYEFDDFLKDPDNTGIDKILKQGNPPIVEPQIAFYKKILEKYKKLTELQRTLMNTGLPFVGGNWGLHGQSHIAHVNEVKTFFPSLEYLEQHYNTQVGLLGKKEYYFQTNKNTRQLFQFNKGEDRGKIESAEMRKMYADLFFLKQFFIEHDMSYEFDDFLKDPTNIRIDARIKANPSIGDVKEEISEILDKYRQLSTTKRNIIYAGWPYLGWRSNNIPKKASLRDAVMQVFPTPSFLLQHYNNMPKRLHMGKELEKSFFVMYNQYEPTQVAWINESRIRGKSETDKMRVLLADIHFLQNLFKEHDMYYAFEAFLKDPTNTKIYRKLEKHPIPNLQDNILSILEKYKNIGQTQRQIINGGLPTVGWAIRDLPHNNLRKEIIAIFPEPGYLQDHHQKINKPLKEEQERQKILKDQARKKAEEQRKMLEAQRLEKERQVQEERRAQEERIRQQALEAQRIKEEQLRQQTGTAQKRNKAEAKQKQPVNKNTSSVNIFSGANTKIQTKEEKENHEISVIFNTIPHEYWSWHGNFAQQFGRYDKKRQKQLDFIAALQNLFNSDGEITPVQKAELLHSALTLLLQELKGETRATRWLGTKSRLETVIEQELEKLSKLSFRVDTSHKELFDYVKDKDEFKKGPNFERLQKFEQLIKKTSKPKYR